jgi:hypothetical protein
VLLGLTLTLCALLSACGGKAERNGSSSTGGMGPTNVGGATATSDCGNASPVTFQAIAAAGSTAQWCLGSPGLTHDYSVLTVDDASGPINLNPPRMRGCSECDLQKAPYPEPPGIVNRIEVHSSTATWDGCVYVLSECPEQGSACSTLKSALVAQYTATLCGFVNPNPEWSGGCEEAPDTAPVSCAIVAFDYPTLSPVTVQMPPPP